MSKADDILKKYGITQVKGSEGSASSSTSNTNSQKAKSTVSAKADGILAKYGVTQVRGAEGGATVSLPSASGSAQSWIDSSKSYLNDAEKYLSSWRKRDDNDQEYASLMKRNSSLIAEAYNWRNQYAGDDEAVSYIDEVISALSNSRGSFKKYLDYYGQWETVDDYNKYVAYQKDRDEKSKYDLDAGQKEIEALEAELKELRKPAASKTYANDRPYAVGQTSPASGYTTGSTMANDRPYAAGQQTQVQREEDPNDAKIRELEKQISQKKQYLNQAKHIQEGITLAGVVDNTDFKANSGYVSTEADGKWDKMTSQYGMGYEDLTYEYINNLNGIRDEIERKHKIYSSSGGDSTFKQNGYDLLNENEIAIYNYYYAKEGKEKAQEYLDNIQETLNIRKATGIYETLEGKTAQELLFGIAAGFDQFESGMKNLVNFKDDYIAQTAYQIASGMVREDLSDNGAKLPDWMGGASLGQVAYDTITTSANMAPSILVGLLNPTAGSLMMGASAAGGAYQQALNEGFDKDQARGYSILVGASEVVMERFLGGISEFGGNALGKTLTNNVANADTALKMIAKRLGGSMISEFREEYLQEVLDPVFQNLMLGTDNEVKLFSSEALYSGILGALTAGIMEGPTTIYSEAKNYSTGKQLKAADISAARLAEIGKTFSADSVAYQLAGKVDENTGAYALGRLFNEIGATLTDQNKADIAKALVEKNMGEITAKKNAEVLAYVVEGGQLTDRQAAIIEANTALAEVARTVLIDANSTVNQRTKGYNEALMALAKEKASPNTAQTKVAEAGKENAPVSDKVDAQKENGSEGSSEVDTSPSQVSSITSIKNRTATIKLEDGSEVSVKDADLSPEDGVRIETIAKIDGISAADANAVLGILRASTGASAQMDSLGASEAYRYGYYGFSVDHMTKHGVFANSLTDSQRQAIYEVGQRARQQQVEKNTPKKADGTAKKTGIYFDDGNGNVVPYSESDMKVTEGKRSAGVKAAMVLRKLGIGGDIYFFESYVNVLGKRVYKDKNGVERPAPNGWYEKKDGSIHIDLNAGKNGEGYVLFTLAHELTHFIEQWSPQKYKVLADFLVENYEKGKSMDELVRAKQDKLSRNRGEKVSYSKAYSEVVADSMEAMLADGNVLDKLIELKAKDNALFTKMKQFFDNLVAKIRNAYKGLTPDSDEGKAVLEMTDSIEKIQQLFAEALVEASENFQSAEKNTTEDGGVDGAYDIQLSYRDEAAFKRFAKTINSIINRAVAGKGYIDGKILVEEIMPVGPKLAAMVAASSGNSIDISQKSIALNSSSIWHEYKRHTHVNQEISRGQIAFTNRQFQNAVKCIVSPDMVETIFSSANNPTQNQSFAYVKKTVRGHYVVVEAVGGKRSPYIYPVMILQFSKDKWNKMISEGKTLGEILLEGDPKKLQALDVEQNKKSRVSAAQFASYEAIANTLRSSQLDTTVAQPETDVKNESAEAVGLAVDEETESVVPEPMFSERTWTESDYEYRGRMVKDKATNYMPNEYWDFSKSGKENAEAYLEMCSRNNKRPKFYKLLQNNGDGSYSLKADGSTDGYWKLLIDFKMYDNDGNGSPQMPVKPEFNMTEANRMLNDYKGGHSQFPVAQGIVDEFVNEYKDSHEGVQFSDRDTESVSNRSLLANAFESVAQNDIERNRLQEYKGKIDLIESEERKLRDLREQIKDLSFAKGPKDTKKIRSLQFEANQAANRINTYDKQLLRLEASAPLQNVLNREKEQARKRAEKKGKEALEAYRERAAKTQRELLDRWEESRKRGIEGRQKTAMRHKIKDVVNDLNQYLLKGTKDRHVPIGLQKAVAEALNAVNMDTVGAEERIAKLNAELMKAKTPEAIQEISKKIEHIREMGDRMDEKLKRLKTAYDEFINSDDPLIANSHDDAVSAHMMKLIVRVGDTPLREMSLDQLQDVYDVYKVVLATIRNANKSFKDNKNREISTRANQVMAEIDGLGVKRGKRPAFMSWVEKFGWDGLKPVYAMEHIGSQGLIDAYNNVRAGEDTWAQDIVEAREYYLEKFRKYKYDSWDFEKKHKFTSTTEMNFELTLDQIMSLYAYSKRDQAADHLKYGGIVFDPKTEVVEKTKSGIKVKYNVANATAYNISEETLADIIGTLTEDQKGFVDEMQTYLSDVMGAKGNEVSLAMYDVKLFREKHYFPLKSAHQYMAKAKEQAQGDVKIKNSGFSKETKPHAKNPIVLSSFMDVWSNHVNEMSMYHAFVLPMEDFYRIYNYTTPSKDETLPTEGVNASIENAYGSGATEYIEQMLKDLNGGARSDSRTGFINKMMGLFKKGAVFASLSVVVQQPSAIARAAALVDTKYFIGPKVDHKRHKALWEEVKQYAPVAIIKEMGYFDTNMGKSTQDFIMGQEYSSFKEKMKALVKDGDYRDEVLSKAPALADEIAWCGIWEAVKRETKANNPGMDVTSEEFLKKVGERFTEVIVKTQVYDSVLSRSALMRSKDTVLKMATAFMAEPTTSINMVADALLKGKRGNRKYARTAIGAVIASQILNSILVSFVYAGRDDDEDETYVEKYIGTLSGEVLDSLNPAGYIPFIKDIMSIVQGYDVERSDMAVVSDLWKAWQNLSKDDVSVYRKVEGFAGSIAQIFGLPVKNIMRDARGIYQTVMSFVNSQEKTTKAGIGYAVKGAITGKSATNKEQLYEARMAGDKEHAARVEARYGDTDSADAAVRAAIKDSFMADEIDEATALKRMVLYAGMDASEAHWTMDDWKYRKAVGSDDGYSKYGRFYDAVRTGKNLKAVVKEYTDNGIKPSTLSGQITEKFKPDYVKMSASQRASMKGYLVNAYALCGIEREDAMENIAVWDWEAQGYDGATAAAVRNYNEYCAADNVPKDIYLYIRKFSNNTDNDVDENGKSINYSAMKKIMAEIDAQRLTAEQKTAIARSLGWVEKNIQKYKTW